MGKPNNIQELHLLLEDFETEGQTKRESEIRVKTLRSSNKPRNHKLAKLLASCCQESPCDSAACPRCFSSVRKWSYSEFIRLKNECGSEEPKIMTVLFYQEMMGNRKLFRYDLDLLKRRLRRQLERSGFTSPVIGYFEFDYHTENKLWLPHFHLMVLGSETQAIKTFREMFRKQKREIGASVSRPLHVVRLKDEVKQVSYLCKSYCCRVETYSDEDGKRRTKKYRLKPNQLCLSLRVLHRFGLTGRLFLYRARLVGKEIRASVCH